MIDAALKRFADKCRFEPETGCVVWAGGKTSGHGCSTHYGSFWFEGRRWFAHRWACIYIHGLDPGEDTVGHFCPSTPGGHPNSLCVQHIRPQSMADNVAERNTRVAAANRLAKQNGTQRLFWKLVQLGYEEPPAHADGWLPTDGPKFDPPDWFRPHMPADWWDQWLEETYGPPTQATYCNPLQEPIPPFAGFDPDPGWSLPGD